MTPSFSGSREAATAVKPILFSGEMVRAILDGRKSQTRRVVTPVPPEWITAFGFTAFTPKNSISGRGYGWDVNPWVWVIEFKKLENSNDLPPSLSRDTDG